MALSIQNLSEPLLAKIMGYAGMRDEQHERVSKAFNAARKKAMQSEWREGLLLSHSIRTTTPLEISNLEKEINDKAATHYPPSAEIVSQWEDYVHFRNGSVTIYNAYTQHGPIKDEARARRYEHLREVSRMLDQMPVNFKEMARLIHEFNAKEGLALKERMVADRGLDYQDSKQITQCFGMLHHMQRTEAQKTYQGRIDFEKIPRGLSHKRNLEVERIIQKVRVEMDSSLFQVWQSIQPLFPAPAGVPDLTASPSVIRAWLNDPVNQPHLDKIWNLAALDRMTAIPPEILKLRYLTNLTVAGVRELPAFLAEFRYLQWCTVQDTGLRLYSLSDAFYRHMESMLYCCEEELPAIDLPNQGGVSEIPFRMWFKREYTISHWAYTFSAFDCFDAWLKREFDPETAECLFELGIRLGFPIFGAIIAFDLLFNITAFLLNLLLIDCIEPVITLMRDRFGYGRMVKLA